MEKLGRSGLGSGMMIVMGDLFHGGPAVERIAVKAGKTCRSGERRSGEPDGQNQVAGRGGGLPYQR